jgi:hypothetical protein
VPYLLILISLFSLPAYPATDAPACQCPEISDKEKTDQATYVFNADVWDVAFDPATKKRVITLDVTDTFKGKPRSQLDVRDDQEGQACTIDFHEGESYLVYVKWQWGVNVTSQCWGTKRLEASGDTSKLGPSAAAKEKYYKYLRERCMGRLDTPCCLSSVRAMRENGFMPQPEAGCPDDLVPDRLRCDGSYLWCAPVSERHGRSAK